VGILRILLALAVVVGHVSNISLLGIMTPQEAVRIFFVISGFYIALILNKKYDSLYLFYSNRFARLYPAYALTLLATIGWFWIYSAYTGQPSDPPWIAQAETGMPTWTWVALQLSNVTMVGLDVPSLFHWKAGQGFLFLHGLELGPTPDGAEPVGRFNWISQAWSIGAEVWFYMLAPFIVRRGLGAQIAVAAASLALMSWMRMSELNAYFFFPANLWLFVSGSILFRLSRSRYFLAPDGAGYLALGYICVATFGVGAIGDSVLHAAALALMAVCIPFLYATFSRKPWDAATGNLSYPVYLVHLLIIYISASLFHEVPAGVVIGASLVVAAFIAHFVDAPMDRFRQRRVQRQASARGVEGQGPRSAMRRGAMPPAVASDSVQARTAGRA
jgi:peptidoglycan/LPS O-acetylase OafA/YrhL